MKTIRKTEADIRRELAARKINETLIGTGMHVVAGGSRGPYALVIDRLSHEALCRLIRLIKKIDCDR